MIVGKSRSRFIGEAGFTVIELVTILGIVGILAAVVLPRFVSSQSYRDVLLKDQLISMARFTQQTALSRHGQRVCLEISLQPTPARWLFEVWAGQEDGLTPSDSCIKTTLVKQQKSEQGGSTLTVNGAPVSATPTVLRFDSMGNLVGASDNLTFVASGRTACISPAGFAYAPASGVCVP